MTTHQRTSAKEARIVQKQIPSNSVARSLVQIGDRWSLLIIGSAFLGIHRFSDWRDAIGVSSNVLTSRLTRLLENGCFCKAASEGNGRETYKLTKKGTDLFPTALMFWRFDRLWSQRRPVQVVSLTHLKCAHAMTPVLVCSQCRQEVHPHDVTYVEGPGARMEGMPPPKSSRRSTETLDNGTLISSLYGESIDFVGDRWTQLVMASFFLGDRRYESIRARWQLAPNVLSDRLRLLVDVGMLERRIYQAKPARSEYVLTTKGIDIYPIVLTLNAWGDRWLASKLGSPLVLTHSKCGAELHPVVACDHCGDEVKAHEVSFTAQ